MVVVLLLIIIAVLVFVVVRYRHYLSMRRSGHDRYKVVRVECTNGQTSYSSCPDMDMMGFKYSVILVLVTVNILLTLYMVYTGYYRR